jgi:hypothetical protein
MTKFKLELEVEMDNDDAKIEDDNVQEELLISLDHVTELVKRGWTSGYEPDWTIKKVE